MGVKLSSTVSVLDVDLGLVDETNDLNVIGSFHVLETGQGASRDDTGTTALLGAPSNFLTLGVTDGRVGLGGCPDTPVIGVVDEGGLAERVWALSGGIAEVVPLLGTTDAVVGVGLVGLAEGEASAGS